MDLAIFMQANPEKVKKEWNISCTLYTSFNSKQPFEKGKTANPNLQLESRVN